jgi:hypothetical protein
MASVESQMDLMRSHVTRGVPVATKTDGGRTPQLAVPDGWTVEAKCAGDWDQFDETVGLNTGEAAARCAGCPVIAECLSAAMSEEAGLSAGSRYLIRGGLSPKERAALEVAGRTCERGHSGRWGSHPNMVKPLCLECKAEDQRERYAVQVTDPQFQQRRNDQQREARGVRMVSCVECRAEMRAVSLGRHLHRFHKQEEAA